MPTICRASKPSNPGLCHSSDRYVLRFLTYVVCRVRNRKGEQQRPDKHAGMRSAA